MKTYKITYRMGPDEKDIIVIYKAKTMEEAIVFAKEYRKDAFSIEEV